MKQPLSKGVKIARNLLFILIAAAILYYRAGCPILFPRLRMQWEEKKALLGPSVLVDELSHDEYSEFEKLLVGETEHGVVFYTIENYNSGHIFYCDKAGDLALVAAPNYVGHHWNLNLLTTLPVYLFVDISGAAHAHISLTITGEYDNSDGGEESMDRVFTAEADRSDNGFFRFMLQGNDELDSVALSCLSTATGGNVLGFPITADLHTIHATVRLYDINDQLITEQKLILYTSDGE